MKLDDKIVVITGGSKGIGKAIAEVLAKEGSLVVICARKKTDLNKVCMSIEKKGGKCEGYVVDVTKKKQVEKFLDKVVSKYGKIDVLINNAGWVSRKKYIETTTDVEYRMYFTTNVDSVFYFLRKIIPIMKRQNYGNIINISSQTGIHANPIMPIYSANKFAIQAFTEAVAKELRELNYNLKCIAICPSGVNTQMRAKLFGKKDANSQQKPEDIANVIRDILIGKIEVPNGGNVHIKHGQVTEVDDVFSNP